MGGKRRKVIVVAAVVVSVVLSTARRETRKIVEHFEIERATGWKLQKEVAYAAPENHGMKNPPRIRRVAT